MYFKNIEKIRVVSKENLDGERELKRKIFDQKYFKAVELKQENTCVGPLF